MCVLAFAWRLHPDWPLVLIGNRDERHGRAAAPLARWPDAEKVLGGRDLVSGGGWLGVSEAGRFAVITNVRGYGPPAPDAPSRGALVQDMLTGAGAYADPDEAALSLFNPMNLITVRDGIAQFWTNRPAPDVRTLSPGLYGMSNGGLDDGWPKTDRLKSFLGAWMDKGGRDGVEPLLGALADEHRPRDENLPATGLPLDIERRASAIFIRDEVYGTRCSSVVAIGEDGTGDFTERRFNSTGRQNGETRLSFVWPGGRSSL